MIKQNSSKEAPIYKKIQNYIFKFSDLLGQGNFSKVYRAHHEVTMVAIKIVQLESLKSKKLEELLFSEIDVLKKLNHPNVLRCFEVFTSNRNCYIITQLCNEGDLESRLRKQGKMDEQRAEPIIRDIFEGLRYLSQKNIIHRDLKIANVFLHKGQAKIADFGFAKFTKDKFKDINIGSPIYMSPEGFIHNIYGPKTDVWAFGVLIYELLHGQTPYSTCRTQTELKQSLLQPLSKNQFRSDLSSQVRQIIMKCMEIDEQKRATISELLETPYFRRLTGKDQMQLPIHLKDQMHLPLHINNGIHSSAMELRLRSPSYNQDNNKFLKSQNNPIKRNISVEKPQLMMTAPYQQQVKINNYPSQRSTYNQLPGPQTSKHLLDPTSSQEIQSRDRRAVSNDRSPIASREPAHLNDRSSREPAHLNDRSSREPAHLNIPKSRQTPANDKSIEKIPPPPVLKTVQSNKFLILSGNLTFKECVNILHYGRLIFKFLLTLKISEYSNDNELFKLSKWLMELLGEINNKIQRKHIVYEGENASLRQQKLKQVRNEYQKKYKSQLSNYIRSQLNYGEQSYSLQYIKNYCYNLFQKYDSLISKQHNKSLLMLGHCIIIMCQSIKILKNCYETSSYTSFMAYKDIESYLNLSKEQIDINSYLNYRKKMVMYN